MKLRFITPRLFHLQTILHEIKIRFFVKLNLISYLEATCFEMASNRSANEDASRAGTAFAN